MGVDVTNHVSKSWKPILQVVGIWCIYSAKYIWKGSNPTRIFRVPQKRSPWLSQPRIPGELEVLEGELEVLERTPSRVSVVSRDSPRGKVSEKSGRFFFWWFSSIIMYTLPKTNGWTPKMMGLGKVTGPFDIYVRFLGCRAISSTLGEGCLKRLLFKPKKQIF